MNDGFVAIRSVKLTDGPLAGYVAPLLPMPRLYIIDQQNRVEHVYAIKNGAAMYVTTQDFTVTA